MIVWIFLPIRSQRTLFLPPENIRKPCGFLMFSGGRERVDMEQNMLRCYHLLALKMWARWHEELANGDFSHQVNEFYSLLMWVRAYYFRLISGFLLTQSWGRNRTRLYNFQRNGYPTEEKVKRDLIGKGAVINLYLNLNH